MESFEALIMGMVEHDAGHPKMIQHFLKVYEFARLIGKAEHLEEGLQFTLETAAVVHDIGILAAKKKYGSGAGKYQEKEGPAEAENFCQDWAGRRRLSREFLIWWGIIIPIRISTGPIIRSWWKRIFW